MDKIYLVMTVLAVIGALQLLALIIITLRIENISMDIEGLRHDTKKIKKRGKNLKNK